MRFDGEREPGGYPLELQSLAAASTQRLVRRLQRRLPRSGSSPAGRALTDKPDYLDEADEDGFARLVEATRKRRPAAAPVRAAAPATPPHDTATVEFQTAASVTPQAIEWLWPGWLARGRLHLLAGQPGAGKTTLALDFAAIISSGGVWPDAARANQGCVVIWSGEDDPADTLVPRLIAEGADLRRDSFRSGHQRGRPIPRFRSSARHGRSGEKEFSARATLRSSSSTRWR